ncbi:stage IV sporulation protein FB [Paenibacillus sp. J31TS4]|uniref:M50 family metallopeptidase n=1 Tax=Paenibacillus sp. J31TS4 TaxID=2807195 RepID=UPI001B13E8C8|nr:M50 family metallopeptidase [Paenibacillus sp. J31TS4]GIP39204.1 stage IV sporulation protein FB [Paenibacillus sp. J31TS4]
MIRAAGIRLRFHPLFVLLLGLSLLTGYFVEMLTLFGIVFIHELGHAAAARSFGWKVTEIQLLPFGGVAVVEDSGAIPAREEIAVALAGPLQNGWMALLAQFMLHAGWGNPDWWAYFLEANLMLALFNLLPVLPLDGGKITQALMSYGLSYYRTLLAGSLVSLVLSVFVIAASLFGREGGLQLNLLAIGLFLLSSNWYGYRHLPFQFLRFLMARGSRFARTLPRGTLARPLLVPGGMTVREILRLFMREQVHLVFILDEVGQIRQIVPEQPLIDSYFDAEKTNRAVSDLFL